MKTTIKIIFAAILVVVGCILAYNYPAYADECSPLYTSFSSKAEAELRSDCYEDVRYPGYSFDFWIVPCAELVSITPFLRFAICYRDAVRGEGRNPYTCMKRISNDGF